MYTAAVTNAYDREGRSHQRRAVWHGPPSPRGAATRPDPERTSCGSFCSFNDPTAICGSSRRSQRGSQAGIDRLASTNSELPMAVAGATTGAVHAHIDPRPAGIAEMERGKWLLSR